MGWVSCGIFQQLINLVSYIFNITSFIICQGQPDINKWSQVWPRLNRYRPSIKLSLLRLCLSIFYESMSVSRLTLLSIFLILLYLFSKYPNLQLAQGQTRHELSLLRFLFHKLYQTTLSFFSILWRHFGRVCNLLILFQLM